LKPGSRYDAGAVLTVLYAFSDPTLVAKQSRPLRY
jgi:hypothetical protein